MIDCIDYPTLRYARFGEAVYQSWLKYFSASPLPPFDNLFPTHLLLYPPTVSIRTEPLSLSRMTLVEEGSPELQEAFQLLF